MRDLARTHSETLYLLGPPGAGKTTIGREVASRTHSSFHTIDDWVPSVYPPSRRSAPMTDADVDRAVALLFDALPTRCVCEFAHHDYRGLLLTGLYSRLAAGRIVVVFASLDVCRLRNEARRSPVSSMYLERSWRSTADFIATCGARDDVRVVDTTITPIEDAVARVAAFYKRGADQWIP